MTRAYHQTLRAELRTKTRERIVQAAHTAFTTRGVLAVRMDDVAAEAGVGRSTVFSHFATKAELLQAVEADAARRAGLFELIALIQSQGPVDGLRSMVVGGTAIWDRERALFREFYAQAGQDPDLRAVVQAKDEVRYGVAEKVLARVEIAPGWTRAEAIESVWVLTGFDVFDRLRSRDPDPAVVLWKLIAPMVSAEGPGGPA